MHCNSSAIYNQHSKLINCKITVSNKRGIEKEDITVEKAFCKFSLLIYAEHWVAWVAWVYSYLKTTSFVFESNHNRPLIKR